MNEPDLGPVEFFDKDRLLLLMSSLQKHIRRSRVPEAMYMAIRLCQMSESAFWSRIIVISNEDIARAPEIVAIECLRGQYMRERERVGRGAVPTGDMLRIAAVAAQVLAEAPKSRIGDEMLWLIDAANHGDSEAVAWVAELGQPPDEALDLHTAEGRRFGRIRGSPEGEAHWLSEGSAVSNPSAFYTVWRARWLAIMLRLTKMRAH